MLTPRLFIGPMSKEIVDIALSYSRAYNPLGIIPSRRQVENTGGYVNDWTTRQFTNHVTSGDGRVLLVRDHGGPGQGSVDDDGIDSLMTDIEAGFDMLHIDPWKKCSDIEEGAQKTLDLIEKCLEESDDVFFEVGTEESIFRYTYNDLEFLLSSLEKKLKDKFHRIKYAVIQSGVEISGTRNIGNFSRKRLCQMTKACKKFGVLSKEHNGDYLSFEQIKERADAGLDSINIAPEFGVTQTRLLLDNQLIDLSDALGVCLRSKKYEKWIPKEMKCDPPGRLVVEVSGHYNFCDPLFKESIPEIKLDLENVLRKRFDEIYSAWSAG